MRKMAGALASCLTVAAITTACSDGNAPGSGSDKAQVMTTFTILENMTKEVAGDSVEVRSLTSPGAEIHGYEPTPHDVAAAERADLIISNGLGLEHWVHKLTDNSPAATMVATDGITPLPIAGTDNPNPHAWMSPALALTYVDNITKALSDLEPEHADTYRHNASEYKKKINKVNTDLLDGLATLPDNHRTLVTCEGAFSYLAKEAGLKEGYIWPVNNDGDITAQQIARAADMVKKNDVPAVFCESTVEPGPQEQLIRDTGAKNGGILYVDSLSDSSGPVPTYLDLLAYDTKTIVKGLGGNDGVSAS